MNPVTVKMSIEMWKIVEPQDLFEYQVKVMQEL